MSRNLRMVKFFGIVAFVIAACLLTLAYAGMNVYQLERQARSDFRENLVWSMAENETQALRLILSLERFGAGDPRVSADDVQLRFNLLWSRLNVPRVGEMEPRLRVAGGTVAVESAVAVLAELEPEIFALKSGEQARAQALASRIEDLLLGLHTATTLTAHGELARISQRSEDRRGALLAALGALGGGALGVLGLIALLVRELRRRKSVLMRAREAERLARDSEQRFRDVVEAASDWIWETDAQHRFVFVSERLRELSGIDPMAVLGKPRTEHRLSEDDPGKWEWHCASLEKHQPFRNFEYPYRDAEGHLRWCRTHGKPVFGVDGRFLGYRGTGRDITREREATQALEESRELLRAVIDAVPGVINVKDTASRYVLINRFQGQVYGVDPAEAIGRCSEDFTGESYGGQSRALDRQVIRTGEPSDFVERDFVDAAGRSYTWWTVKQPLKDSQGQVRYIVTVALDVGALKASERARSNLSRYLSPNMVELLAAKAEPLDQVREQDVAVIFTDLFDFTRLAAQEPPDHTMALLRDLHGRLTDVVLQHGGTLEKFLGDGLMATFGTPVSSGRDATRALECVCALALAMEDWNTGRIAKGEKPLQIGIGAHFGPVILGDIGTERRLEYAVVGDTVNLASRLEGLTRRLDTRAVVSGALMQAVAEESEAVQTLAEAFVSAGEQAVAGYDSTVMVWRLVFSKLREQRAMACKTQSGEGAGVSASADAAGRSQKLTIV